MTPERIAELRNHTPYCIEHYAPIGRCAPDCPAEDNAEMLDEIERLRRLVREAHDLEPAYRDGYHEEWHCTCYEFLGLGPEAPTSRPGEPLSEGDARNVLAAHVAQILDGGAE